MTSHDFVVIGGVGLLMTLPLKGYWRMIVSIALLVLGLLGKNFNL